MENTSPVAAQVKQRLYAMRNGIVADSLRKAGCPHRMIFGVNLPQLVGVASEFEPSAALADELWADKSLRESRLTAAMLYPVEELDRKRAGEMINDIMWQEEADILCFKLLRKTDFAAQLAADLCESEFPLKRYAGLRLWFNIVGKHPSEALAAAENELKRSEPIALASMLSEEAQFLLNGC